MTNNKTKKKILVFSILFTIISLFLAITFSFRSWSSTSNTAINIGVDELNSYIIYNEGTSVLSGDINPGQNYNNGMHTTITLYKSNAATSKTIYGYIYLDVNEIGTNLNNEPALKWAIVAGETSSTDVIAEGNFIGTTEGSSIPLKVNIPLTTTLQKYTIWIWLDENLEINPDVEGETISTEVRAEATEKEAFGFTIGNVKAVANRITASVQDSSYQITNYAITSSITTPSSWTNISPTNFYTFDNMVDDTGTYYLWFKNSNNDIIYEDVQVTEIDTVPPILSVNVTNGETYMPSKTATISLTDALSGLPTGESYTVYYGWSTSAITTCNSTNLPNSETLTTASPSTAVTISSGTGAGKFYACLASNAADKIGNVLTPSASLTNANMYLNNSVITISPIISHSIVGGTADASAVVNVSGSSSNITTLKYLWSQSSTVTDETINNTGTTFISGDTIEKTDGDGHWYLCIYAEDNVGNTKNSCFDAGYLDHSPPHSSITPNGNSTYAKSQSATITAEDATELIASKYLWTQLGSGNPLADGAIFTSGQTVTKDTGDGNWKLCLGLYDYAHNSLTHCSDWFYLDNTPPALSVSVTDGTTYTQSKTATISLADALSGLPTAGSYTAYYGWSTSTITTCNSTNLPNSTTLTSASPSTTVTISSETGAGKFYACLASDATDTAGNILTPSASLISADMYLDNTKPNIGFSPNGNSTYATSQSTTVTVSDTSGVVASSLKYLWSQSSNADASTGTTFTSGESISKSSADGDWYLCIYAEDNIGNSGSTCSNVFKLDNSNPNIGFSPNGNSSYSNIQSTTVTATDLSGFSSLKYLWSTSSSANASNGTAFTSGESISKSTGSGNWYLCIYAEDTAGHSLNQCSNVFRLDTTDPSLSVSVSSGTTYAKSKTATISLYDANGLSGGTYYLEYKWSTSSVRWNCTGLDPTAQDNCENLLSDAISTSISVTAGATSASKTVTISGKTGSGKIYVSNLNLSIYDLAGNALNEYSSASANMYLDNTGPTCTDTSSGSTSWGNPKTVLMNFSDPESGVNYSSSVSVSYYNAPGCTSSQSACNTGYTLDASGSMPTAYTSKSGYTSNGGYRTGNYSRSISSSGYRRMKFNMYDMLGNATTCYSNFYYVS